MGTRGKRFIGAGSNPDMTDRFAHGIVTRHAYSVQEAHISEHAMLIKLRNPWNRSEWKGNWSDGDRMWKSNAGKEVLKAISEHHSEDDGAFWMALDDFVARFDTLDICDCVAEGRTERIKALR